MIDSPMEDDLPHRACQGRMRVADAQWLAGVSEWRNGGTPQNQDTWSWSCDETLLR